MNVLSSYSSHLKAFGTGIVLALLALGGYLYFQPASGSDFPTVTVYKSPSCQCCTKWVSHLEDNGFSVDVSSRLNMKPVKRQMGVPSSLGACHTAVVGNYVVEGHVPAREVKRLLKKKPSVRGLAVPGMPIGSPGMEQGNRIEPYDVVAFTAAGDTAVFAEYGRR